MKLAALFLLVSTVAFAQDEGTKLTDLSQAINNTLSSKWYEKIQIRGYSQIRYNRSFEQNRDFESTHDKSVGDSGGFFLRRGRIIFFGDVSDRVYIYIQPDYGTEVAGRQNVLNIRDAYFDYALTSDKDWRVRTGVSKVPYGFENLQSSSNRAALDRNDALNSAVPNERDMGVYLMYAPKEVRERFSQLTNARLKGSGDYGMLAIGGYNGQTLNQAERNNDLHRLVRLTYPFKLNNGQFVETSIQAYEGKFASTGGTLGTEYVDFYDQRTAASLIVYPQPIGLQMEYTVGRGPEYDPSSDSVRAKDLRGGYVQLNYNTDINGHRLFPFIKFQEFRGARKLESGAPSVRTNEWDFGTEWQPNKALEITATYTISKRVSQSTADNRFSENGQMVRLQAQFNY